ncbi:hypothetical protein BGX26_000873 [Mortierella sp. AD094]|nr:hypothetical protein BGX26_000873 [Mortierella sp. AD094]
MDPKQKFWTSPGMDMFVDWATNPNNYRRFTRPRPFQGQRAVDLYDDIAAKVNAINGTKWNRKLVKGKFQYAREKYDLAREILKSAETGNTDKKTIQERIMAVCPHYDRFHAVYTSSTERSPPPEPHYYHSGSTIGKRAAFVEEDLEADAFGSDISFYDLPDSEAEDAPSERSKSVRPAGVVGIQRIQAGSAYTEKRQKLKDDAPTLEIVDTPNETRKGFDNSRLDLNEYEEFHTKRIQELERLHMEMVDRRTQELEMTFNRRLRNLAEEKAEFSEKMERERQEFSAKMDRERKEFSVKMEREKVDLKEERQEFKQQMKEFLAERLDLVRENAALKREIELPEAVRPKM